MKRLHVLHQVALPALVFATYYAMARGQDPAAKTETPPAASGKVDFVRDVQPIFTRHCFDCHGPEKQKSNFRLDRKKEALAGGDMGDDIIAGKSAESLVIQLVSGEDPDHIMPPKGERLSAKEIGVLRAWIDQGANWPDGVVANSAETFIKTQWSLHPLAAIEAPAVKNGAWVRNPIDSFVLSRLEREGISPSPEADRTTLIRRLSLDLLGLPPSLADVDQFVNDQHPQAYEQLVDRLLASPHFGERWGRHWLDLARYADSDGYEKDTPRPFAWRYRNWVIDAFNRDLPFDQFTIEQIAGDELPNATIEQKVATGFHRNTLTNKEGGVDQEEFRVAAVIDRVNTTGTVWLGLTVGCAQCHNHKYDPIQQKEYYQLFAFFNSGNEVDLSAPLASEVEAYAKAKAAFDAEHAPLVEALAKFEKEQLPARFAEWEKSPAAPRASWQPLKPAAAFAASGAKLEIRPDSSVFVTGINPAADKYTVVAHSTQTGITAFKIEALADPSLPSKGPGRTDHGNFVLTDFKVTAHPAEGDVFSAQAVELQNASADFAQRKFPASDAIDADAKTGWAVAPQFGKSHTAVFETKTDAGSSTGTTFTFTLEQRYGDKHTIGAFRISAIGTPRPVNVETDPDDIGAILARKPEERTQKEAELLLTSYKKRDPEWQRLNAPVVEHAKKAPKPPETKAQTLAELEKPRQTFIHVRGDFLRKGDEVQPGTLAILPPLKATGATPSRLDFARWLVDPANPLTPRVHMNRVWRTLFGRPLTPSVDDFGMRGEPPSHPELLDWLAREFIARGWSQKAMIELIVTSATYRQSSATRPELVERDPNNALLARQNRFRADAEIVRDLALAASGLFNPTIGGPSVFPPQPPGISDLTYAGSGKWVESNGPDRYRRGMYTFFRRTSPYPMLLTFDAPDSNVCAAKRERSNTPLQALTLLNDTAFVECAQALAKRTLRESAATAPADRARQMFRIALAREPNSEEAAALKSLFEQAVSENNANLEQAKKLAGENWPDSVSPPEAAAWVAVARTILNLDEFVTRE